ncbi:MAG: AAA family ATPase [Muribaculaceae bacterium]|nr:AAA family ATPase [Muribaculaceae bacterium]
MPIDNCQILVNGKPERNIKEVYKFSQYGTKYYAITFGSDFTRHFRENEVNFRRSCLEGKTSELFDYMKRCAEINTLGFKKDDENSKKILLSIYNDIKFIDEETAAAVYLKPNRGIKQHNLDTPLFPFGCNASQETAVKAALSNQISVIQGPPGTGKTQTILNIIANLIKEKKSVLIVSNNNSATENVLEKLSKNGLGFLVAPLGNKKNKEAFIANQPPLNPDLPDWRISYVEQKQASSAVKTSLDKTEALFCMQAKLAMCRQELAEVKIEMSHYEQENDLNFNCRKINTPSSRILKISKQIKEYAIKYQNDTKSLMKRLRRFFDKLNIELRLRFLADVKEELTSESIVRIISMLDWLFYIRKEQELSSEIENITDCLSKLDAQMLMKSLTDNSMILLKASVAERYRDGRSVIPNVEYLSKNGESVLVDYPIVLSTTFSSKTCFKGDILFDYVIMDEASQVSIETGLLAMMCAKNAVIVGDTKQLPNVRKEDEKNTLEDIWVSSNVPDSYNTAHLSFLNSILETIPDVPKTLLREHYRCHPDIINFCNQKFYDGELLIMTKREDNDKHLYVLSTVEGHHCRNNYNQREIDAIKMELMPLLDNLDETGIIAPYNNQVDEFSVQIPGIEVATVHKYQGREKDTIIMSVTKDLITEFADDANLLNVAVSRAKNKFCLVVTGNPQERKGNIHDLIEYIKYQQGIVIQSQLRSIFDYLFSKIDEHERENTKISEYRSENLTFDLIEKISKTYPHLSHIKTICHYPMRYLIKDTSNLTERESKYALHHSTHIDFIIINRVTKEPLIAIETDGYSFHNENCEQIQRDRMKDHILELYGLPLLRLSTVGYGEEQKIVDLLNKVIS